ncbi:DUF2470 domain-containing protein [Streptomyces sp. NBC_00102]|uniref:DUF2470 domain-containing protein n=1 Tax=Streptomyces sp. NBC_00102 TaxID=2975652 RepID=UPI00225B1BE5|nr:DUF2470 domain-containing protein [Streptomyces sp. NBC_00102]MCX5402414.1 DUF2470 domain-containing protein [Streptomyces sp. NBC_00102]
MRTPSSDPTQPTPAERVRSILRAAQSMTVVSDGGHHDVHRLDEDGGAMGAVHLHAPDDGTLSPSTPRFPVRLELTDIAPTSVRDRLRARVTLTGLMNAPYDDESPGSTCLEFGQAVLECDGDRYFVTLEELEEVAVDPTATSEAGMLMHLMDSHQELVPLLVRLVRPRPKRGMLRAVPVAMDRYGMTLRLEFPGTHQDERLPFATPITRLEQAGPQIHALLSAARRASHLGPLLT